jgi:hypothetical protein
MPSGSGLVARCGSPIELCLGIFVTRSPITTGIASWRGSAKLDEFRHIFGDERADYSQALQIYYSSGAPADWAQHFVSAYAAAHPWEDFAETWAHYFHMVDTLETAAEHRPAGSLPLRAERGRDREAHLHSRVIR